MTPVFELCDEYVMKLAALDPVSAGMRGVVGDLGVETDYTPDGYDARAELVNTTLVALGRLPVTSEADRHAADHLRERLEAQAAWHATGEHLCGLRAQFGMVNSLRDSVDLLPRTDDEAWAQIAGRLRALPRMLAGWRESLDLGLERGLRAARRQAVETAEQADRYAAGTHDALVARYGDGQLAAELSRRPPRHTRATPSWPATWGSSVVLRLSGRGFSGLSRVAGQEQLFRRQAKRLSRRFRRAGCAVRCTGVGR